MSWQLILKKEEILIKNEKFIQDASSWNFMGEDGVPYYDSAISSEWSKGLCNDIACAVNSYLNDLGYDAEELDVFHRDTNVAHTVSKVGNYIVDYSRKQFDKNADVPTIQTLDDFYLEFMDNRGDRK